MRRFESFYLGETPYQAGLEWQRQESERVRETQVARILGLEHPSVITMGRRASEERDLRSSPEELKEKGVELFQVERGGEATLHSPGQLVIYPLIPLREWNLGVREYVDSLRAVTKATLDALGVHSFCKSESEPGLYTLKGKIAFFGIRVDRGVSCHGISLNVRNDLTLFDNIVSCGVKQESFDSLANHDINASLLEIFTLWTQEFRRHFILTSDAPRTNLDCSIDMRS